MRLLIIYNAFLDVIRILDTAFCQLKNGMNFEDLIDHYRPSAIRGFLGGGGAEVKRKFFTQMAPQGLSLFLTPNSYKRQISSSIGVDLLMEGITAI